MLKPDGQFLLMIVNVNWVTWLVSPHAIAHHPRQDPEEWRRSLRQAGFSVEESGTAPGTQYFLARKN